MQTRLAMAGWAWAFTLLASSPLLAQARVTYTAPQPAQGDLGDTPAASRVARPAAVADDAGAEPRKRELVLAPLPMINPTLGNGVAVVAGVLYPVGAKPAPPSATMVMGFRTSNDSWALGAAQSLHLAGDRYRILAAGGYLDVNFDYFGIGNSAGDASRSIPVNQGGYGGISELLVGLGGRWYLGARYRLMRTAVSVDLTDAAIPIPPRDIRLRSASLGPHLERDTRDNPFYPRRGTLFDAMAGFADESLGGQRTYQLYQAAFSHYSSLSPRQVVAAKINSCFADGDAPFYDLCLIGQFQDLRGYETGQYRDRSMLTAQVEYRVELWRRIGATMFGGLGEVAPAFGDFTFDNVLPTGGAGFRFTLSKGSHVNLRIDYAWGKRSNALYVSVGEAF